MSRFASLAEKLAQMLQDTAARKDDASWPNVFSPPLFLWIEILI
jgi:hypothetical protein